MNNNILIINYKRFFKNKLFLISTIAFVVVSIGYLIIGFLRDIHMGDDLFQFVYPLWKTNSISIYSFSFFLFLSYEFCSKIYTNKSYETILCTNSKLSKICKYNLIVLLLSNTLYSIALFVYNYFAFVIIYDFDYRYLLHIALNILVNIFLINTLAIIFGQTMSFIKNKIISYLIMIMFLLISSKVGESLASTISLASDYNIPSFSIFNLFNIFPPNLNWSPTYAMGFSVLPYRVELICFWIFVFSLVFLLLIRKKPANLKALVAFVMALISIFMYVQPQSKLVLNNDPYGEALGDQLYYSNYELESETSEFCINEYDININVNNEMECSVSMITNVYIPKYSFTLYHGFEIQNVKDQNNKQLEYIRDGDYLTVYASDGMSIITVDYKGNGKAFYTNYQGLYLAGDFPYYPVAGKQAIYKDGYMPVIPSNKPIFNITIDMISDLQIYSNLDSTDTKHFYGETNAPCFFAGFLKTKTVNKLTIVYPYLYGESIYIDEIVNNIYLDNNVKTTIFIEPHVNVDFYEPVRKYNNVILTPDLGALVVDESEVE